MFKSLSAELEPDGRKRFAFSESGKQPAGQPAAAVVVDPPVGLAELPGGYHGVAPNPYCLKAEAATALANKLLVFRHIYKLTQHGFPVKQGKEGRQDDLPRKVGLAEKDI